MYCNLYSGSLWVLCNVKVTNALAYCQKRFKAENDCHDGIGFMQCERDKRSRLFVKKSFMAVNECYDRVVLHLSLLPCGNDKCSSSFQKKSFMAPLQWVPLGIVQCKSNKCSSLLSKTF